jgi:ADP-ribosylation factor protein 6
MRYYWYLPTSRTFQEVGLQESLRRSEAAANTIDTAMRPDELSRRLKLDDIAKNHIWKVEPSCATTGEGIFEGLVCV